MMQLSLKADRSVCCCRLQVTLVATAPLTNLAVAVQLDPSLPKNLKALYIMGGNIECTLPAKHIKTCSSLQMYHLSV